MKSTDFAMRKRKRPASALPTSAVTLKPERPGIGSVPFNRLRAELEAILTTCSTALILVIASYSVPSLVTLFCKSNLLWRLDEEVSPPRWIRTQLSTGERKKTKEKEKEQEEGKW